MVALAPLLWLALVSALGLTAPVSYGILSYGFSVLIAPMSTELGWSKTQITGAFSLGQLLAGAAAIPVGLWVDRHGARALMTAGSSSRRRSSSAGRSCTRSSRCTYCKR